MPPRRRTVSTNRRPRVAGLAPSGPRPDEAEGESRTSTVTEHRPTTRRADEERLTARSSHRVGPPTVGDTDRAAGRAPDDDEGVAAEGRVELTKAQVPAVHEGSRTEQEDEATSTTARPGRRTALFARLRTVPVLVGALVVLVGLAVFFGVATFALRSTPAATNTALTDVATTAEVTNQLGDALETVYSYDFARLDENERAAREVITTGFSAEFERLFAQVRELAPQQQAVVSAKINVSAVQEIRGDRAVLVAFMDQQASTAATAEQATAAGRLTVTGERVDGRWKIAAVESN